MTKMNRKIKSYNYQVCQPNEHLKESTTRCKIIISNNSSNDRVSLEQLKDSNHLKRVMILQVSLDLDESIPSNLSGRECAIKPTEEQEINGNFHSNKRKIRPIKRRMSKQHISKNLVRTIAILNLFTLPQTILAQCPANTMTSFERIGSITVKDAILTVLYTTPNVTSPTGSNSLGTNSFSPQVVKPLQSIRYPPSSSLTMSTSPSSLLVGPNGFLSGGAPSSSLTSNSVLSSSTLADLNQLTRQLVTSAPIHTQPIPITAECNNRCRRSAKCRAFLVDYARHTCYSVESVSSNNNNGLTKAPTPIKLAPTNERTAYFEKVCLNLPPTDCERAWVFERVMAHHLYGHDDKIIDDVPNRLRCQEHCLSERDFRCRSGEYDYLTMQCRLSMSDRHLKANLFRPTSTNVDYFENQCVPIGNQCDAFDRYEDLDLGRAEIMRSANTSDQCQQYCTQTIKAFVCRSFTWSPMTGKCYLNSANSQMVGGLDKLISAPGMIYYQRNDCIDLKLECDHNAMTLQLRTNEPFRGRMYVRDDPSACETLGRSALQSTLSIPFHSPVARCATRELPSRFSSVVVVQQHPLIQRRSDRYIKLVCDFQTANKTITSSYNVVANAWTSAALINATSFAPKIRLRITDKFGIDITGARLGDELYLRIEAESDSVYDMVARSVLAKSGTTDETIVLIDRDGCPADYRIFPPLKKLNRRTIVGKFDAFKFSSDVVVRFQVDVQFCLNQCPPTNCDQSMTLFNTNPSALHGTQQATNQQVTGSNVDSTGSASSAHHQASIDSNGNSTNNNRLHQSIGGGVVSGGGGAELSGSNGLGSSSVAAHTMSPQINEPANNGISSENINEPHQLPSNSFYASNSMIGRLGNSNNGIQAVINQAPLSQQNVLATGFTAAPSTSTVNGSGGGSSTGSTSSSTLVSSSQLDHAGGDMQTFEAGQMATSRQLGSSSSRRPTEQQQIFSNSISESVPSEQTTGTDPMNANTLSALDDQQVVQQSNSHQPQHNHQQHRERRRRSAEPMPETPRHVPLQREIVVIESPNGAPSPSIGNPTGGSNDANNGSRAASNGRKSIRAGRRVTTSSGSSLTMTNADNTANFDRASSTKDHSGSYMGNQQRTRDTIVAGSELRHYSKNTNNDDNFNRQQQPLQVSAEISSSTTNSNKDYDSFLDSHADDDGIKNLPRELLCTTRSSLVLAAVAFCALQLLTISICVATWLYHRRRHRDADFKIRPTMSGTAHRERLY